MNRKPAIEVVPDGVAWLVRQEVSHKIEGRYFLKAKAKIAGRAVARWTDSELVIKDRKGRIREKNTYPRERDPGDTSG